MSTFEYVIKDENGIHARPAGLLAKRAREYGCEIIIECGDKKADAKKLLALMGMGIKKGDTVRVVASDSSDISDLKNFFEKNL